MDFYYRKADDQPANVRESGSDRQDGTAGEVALFKAIVEVCSVAEVFLPDDLGDLLRTIEKWGQYATGLSRWRGQ